MNVIHTQQSINEPQSVKCPIVQCLWPCWLTHAYFNQISVGQPAGSKKLNNINVFLLCYVYSSLFWVTGRFGPESFRPRVVSALSRSAWVVSAWVDSALGRFGPVWWVVSAYFFSTIRLVTEGQLNAFWLVGKCMGRGKALGLCTGWFTQTKAMVPTN